VKVSSLVAAVGRYALFIVDLVRSVSRHGVPWGKAIEAAYRIGIRSLPILLVIAGFVGSNLSIQGYAAFKPLGGQRMVGMFVGLAGVRELAPIIAASMVAAKAGTEMASQVGVMRIQEQLDALEGMAVNPLAWIIAPRLVGILFVLPALTLIAIFVMLASAYLVAVFQLGLNGATFIEFAAEGIAPIDFVYGQIKGMVFGVVICTVSCWFGLTCESGPEGVGKATNRAVVTSAVLCVLINYFLSELMYGGAGWG
jgi:phospholipid/cholesterol/gamma-HCH transport system permease protein